MKEIKGFIHFIKENRKPIFLILGLYLLLAIYLGNINYYYIDDLSRRENGYTNFGLHYARYFSEISSWLVQGSNHLTDLGLTTYVLSGMILTIISVLAIYLLGNKKQITWTAAVASIFIGINPWSLELLSFRFDSPYMLLSILVSFIPFLWYRTNKKLFFISSIVGVFLMFNSYQASSGIYISLVLLLGCLAYLKDENIGEWLSWSVSSAFSYGLALVAYLVEMKLNPQLAQRGDTTEMASLADMPQAIWNNLSAYFAFYREGLPRIWKALVLFALVMFFVTLVRRAKMATLKASVFSVLSLVLASVMSIGVYMVTSLPLVDDRPRYAYGLALIISLVMIYVASRLSKGISGSLVSLSILGLIYYSYTFALNYVSALDNQKIDFETQSAVLASSLNNYVTETNNRVYINRLFEESIVFENSRHNNNMLARLVPSNASLYWPNVMWYNQITHSNVEFIAKDLSTEDMSNYELLEDTYNFDIYQKDGEIFVMMK